ncbi:MAG: hypothetical protein V3R64_03195 [Sphingomonadales bacterium]
MIIVICNDDPSLMGIANVSASQDPDVFGAVYQAYGVPIPQLAKGENLFILSHGALLGDEDGPVIGGKEDDFYTTPSMLFANIQNLFPPGWSGNVFIDACESATKNKALLSFAQVFLYPMADKNPNVHVSGIVGLSSGLIPLPDDPKWKTFPEYLAEFFAGPGHS